ncbi:hypothetical protein DL991_23645 [Amycolatopsis sp. WAC 01375]|uniref:hypothetical protein n=1 Tax=unclassified Amycolatopsis TaxID=2618356 RepID=UPI000F7695FF|nr:MULTISPECIES: hypothetical protein [unclassified Amycolatopsis]RSM76656.1 hypothetical protein DL991_23645 [Amycolatopsis sp. WAC 01375]RSN33751.1 hypothetical protein DL990_16470 [Amycolatopsis sp. WAC 01416]
MTINDDRGATLPRAQDIDSAYPLSTGQYPPPSAAPGALAEQTISDTLGWKWREGDTKGFVAALTGSFELKEVQGRTEAKWTPRGYAIQADLGAVTGGQASLAARARSAVKDSLALLDSLRPLRTDSDPENAEGFRALVRHDLEQIRQELESPLLRVARVDQLFLLLLGDGTRGHLGQLRDELGLVSGKVNTIEEERIQTSFITLTDWVVSLFRGWQDARDKIDPFSQPAGGQPFFGPAVVALSRLLSAAASQVDEVVAMLRSVFIQQEDLEVLRVPDPEGGTMSLGGLLRWIREFATFEGGKLIESAGKEGVGTSFIQIARRLQRIVANLPRQSTGGPNGDVPGNFRASLPPGFFSSRVQRAIDELDDHLQEVVRIAEPIGRPGTPSSPSDPNPPAPPTPQLMPQPTSPPPPLPPPSSGRTPAVPSVAELREGHALQEEQTPPEAEEPPKPRTTRKRTGQ